MKNNLILIGYMGCGKSTVGQRLAKATGRDFLDTDTYIEKKEGRTITAIFADDGEEYFRELETACVQELLNTTDNTVLSVGGGLPMREENRELLRELGTVVYLKARPDTIYNRIKDDTSRPLLQTPDPRQRIEEMLIGREARYVQTAHHTIIVDGKSFDDIIQEIKLL